MWFLILYNIDSLGSDLIDMLGALNMFQYNTYNSSSKEVYDVWEARLYLYCFKKLLLLYVLIVYYVVL